MQFKTSLTTSPYPYNISHKNTILSIGSCFAQLIGQKLLQAKFQINSNPFGTIYNPLSILRLLNFSIDKEYPESSSYLENQGLFYNYYMHGDLSDFSRSKLEEKVINTIDKVHEQLRQADWMMITLGTAYVYRREDTNTIVANCHKVPAKHFNRKMLTINEISDSFNEFFTKLKAFNPNIRIILTVSPVRHVRDGLPQNSVSKATLRLASQQLIESNNFIDYFPSFEFMIDDLRDYRFYADDLVHPSNMAEDYIWQNFQFRYMSEATRQLVREWGKIKQAIDHRPYYPQSPQHQDFLRKTIEKLQQFRGKLNITRELEILKNQLI